MPDWGTLERSHAEGFEATLDRILHDDREKEDPSFDRLSATIGDAASTSGNSERLRAWWVFRMLGTKRPLVERLTLLWHNHFATSNDKVQDVSAMFEQNDIFRRLGRGPFRELLQAVVKHRAMLIWLDANANRKEHPNENLARELMELFTLGEGEYTERDVKEAARCLTGWTLRQQRFVFIEELHDSGEKTVLGRTSKFQGDDLLDHLLEQDATARRIAWRLGELFFGEGVLDDAASESLAQGLKKNRLDIAWGIETILRSQLFFSDANIRSRVMSPVEFVIGTVRSLEISSDPPSTLLLATELRRLGQDLFHPPNVFGWSEGRSWVHTRSMIAKERFVTQLVSGQLHPPGHAPFDLLELGQRLGRGESIEEVAEWIDRVLSSAPSRRLKENEKVRTAEGLRDLVVQWLMKPENQLG